MRIWFLGILLIAGLPFLSWAQVSFVDGVWFDSTKVVQYQPVQIFVVLKNQTPKPQQAKVSIYLDDTLIQSHSVKIPANNISLATFEIRPKISGKHKVIAKISQNSTPVATLSSPDELIILKDTDKDSIPDEKDPDDDNDGIPDEKDPQPLIAQSNSKQAKHEKDGAFLEFLPISEPVKEQLQEAGDLAAQVAHNTKQVIDPLMQKASETLEEKSKDITQKITSNIPDKNSPTSSQWQSASVLDAFKAGMSQDNKFSYYLNLLLANILLAFAFVTHHWIWHLLAAVLLVILHKIYKKFKKPKYENE